MDRIELTKDIANFIELKSGGLYTVNILNILADSNDFFFDAAYGFIRIQEGLFKNNHVWAHGSFWGPGIYRNLYRFGSILQYIKNKYKVDYLLVEIPEDTKSLHKLLLAMGFNIDLAWQEEAEHKKIVYSLNIDEYLRRNM